MNRGFSGGSIVWHDTFLTKTAKDKEANGRLSYEVCRLDYMRKKFWPLFSVPGVPQNKVRFNEEGILCYDIERINAPRLEDAILELKKDQVEHLAVRLAEIVGIFSLYPANPAPRSNKYIPEEEFIRGKLENAYEHIRIYTWPEVEEFRKAINFITIKNPMLTTFCHGDLAFDNILIDDNVLYFIDPNCQGFDHYYWDAAKLMQSALAHWPEVKSDAAVRESHKNLTLFADIFLERTECSKHRLTLYLATVLARIIPYCHSTRQQYLLLTMLLPLLYQYLSGQSLKPEPLQIGDRT